MGNIAETDSTERVGTEAAGTKVARLETDRREGVAMPVGTDGAETDRTVGETTASEGDDAVKEGEGTDATTPGNAIEIDDKPRDVERIATDGVCVDGSAADGTLVDNDPVGILTWLLENCGTTPDVAAEGTDKDVEGAWITGAESEGDSKLAVVGILAGAPTDVLGMTMDADGTVGDSLVRDEISGEMIVVSEVGTVTGIVANVGIVNVELRLTLELPAGPADWDGGADAWVDAAGT